MTDDPLEQLLKGYRLPAVSPDLDRRVLAEGATILARPRFSSQLGEIGREMLHRLGFGYLPWLFDLVTTTDAEYSVEFI